jgi:hypothetical protein
MSNALTGWVEYYIKWTVSRLIGTSTGPYHLASGLGQPWGTNSRTPGLVKKTLHDCA